MKISFKHLLTVTLVAVVLAGVPVLRAADTAPAGETAPAKPKKTTYPFHGTVESATGSTVSLKRAKGGARVLKTDEKSKIEVDGKPGSLADVTAGKYAHGTVHKDASGAEVIVKAKFDDHAPAANTGAASASPAAPSPAVSAPSAATPVATAATNAPAATDTVKKKRSHKKKSAATNDVDQATAPAAQ